MAPKTKKSTPSTVSRLSDKTEVSRLLDPLLNHLVEFGKKKGIKRTRVKIGDLEAEVEFALTGEPLTQTSRLAATQPPQPENRKPSPSQNLAPMSRAESRVDSSGTPPGTDSAKGDFSIEEIEKNPNYKLVRSPLVGTFYRASSPGSKPFVEVGDSVKKGQPLAMVEAMKLFNEIESEFEGTLDKVLVENESAVEYNQPLFVISV
jgi:acetyl-CoA carboxylase biotin carboxyl carrier protein